MKRGRGRSAHARRGEVERDRGREVGIRRDARGAQGEPGERGDRACSVRGEGCKGRVGELHRVVDLRIARGGAALLLCVGRRVDAGFCPAAGERRGHVLFDFADEVGAVGGGGGAVEAEGEGHEGVEGGVEV